MRFSKKKKKKKQKTLNGSITEQKIGRIIIELFLCKEVPVFVLNTK